MDCWSLPSAYSARISFTLRVSLFLIKIWSIAFQIRFTSFRSVNPCPWYGSKIPDPISVRFKSKPNDWTLICVGAPPASTGSACKSRCCVLSITGQSDCRRAYTCWSFSHILAHTPHPHTHSHTAISYSLLVKLIVSFVMAPGSRICHAYGTWQLCLPVESSASRPSPLGGPGECFVSHNVGNPNRGDGLAPVSGWSADSCHSGNP